MSLETLDKREKLLYNEDDKLRIVPFYQVSYKMCKEMKGKRIGLLLALILTMGYASCTEKPKTPSTGVGETVKLTPSVLDGKVANLLEAEGVGILDKTDGVASATPSSSRMLVAHADEDEAMQKKTELAKQTENGVEDLHFHEPTEGEKSYTELNEKYGKHHHDKVECDKENCDKISDEVAKAEEEGKADTVLSLDARVNKLYTVGDFTFFSVSSAVKGNAFVWTEKTNLPQSYGKDYWQRKGFDTKVNIEDNFVEDGGWAFSWICIADEDGKQKGAIPIQVREGEKNYHQINYWSDDYNQSYVVDNKTGMTYSLSQFKYIYSVSNGVIKVHDGISGNGFSYYLPVITSSGLECKKIELPGLVEGSADYDKDFAYRIAGCKVHADIYGNLVFSYNDLTNGESAEGIDEYGERKLDDKIIFAKKNSQIAEGLPLRAQRRYSSANRYFNGSDGRIYRVNFFGDINDISVNVLNENCQWQEVEESADVEFSYGYICAQVGDRATDYAALLITRIKNGEAYYSTAAHTDGVMLWPQASFAHDENDFTGKNFVGVVKMPTDKTKPNTVQDFIDEFDCKGYPIYNGQHAYTVYLVGKTQMLYFGTNEIVLRDVATGQERKIETPLTKGDFGPYGNKIITNVFVKGLGYLNLLNEVDFDTFGKDSFSAEPIVNESAFEEYYKLLKDRGA